MVWCFWPSDDLDAQQLLAKEHVVAVVQQPLFVDFDERSILRPEVGQGYLTVGRDAHLRVLSRNERIIEKIHVVALAADRDRLAARTIDHADLAAAQPLDEAHLGRPLRAGIE